MDNSRVVISSSLYFVLYLILNYTIFYGISSLFNLPRGEMYYFIIVILALSHPLAIILLKFTSNIVIRALYAVSAVWIGVSAYILLLFALYLITGYFVNIPSQTAGILILGAAFIISIYALYNVTRMKIEEISIPLDIEKNVRAVQISDVHIGPIRKEGFVRGMVNKIVELDPEIVFITGDLFDGPIKLENNILTDFNRIKVPVIFVMGNHDFYQGLDEVNRYIGIPHVDKLSNQVFNFNGIQIVGVPFAGNREFLGNLLDKIEFDKEKPTILLYHLPKDFKAAVDAGVDLQLSGHTHAGQFIPFNFFVKLVFPYLKGLYEKEGSYLYVSQGTGTLGPPMRLGSRCEITLINLTASK